MDKQSSKTIKFSKKHTTLILKLSILSRIITWIIALISKFILDDYDSSVDVILKSQESTIIQKIFNGCFRVFLRWDTFYFTHISEEGYVYEQEHAFFPLLPLLARGLSDSGKFQFCQKAEFYQKSKLTFI